MDTGTAGLVAVLAGCLVAALLLWLGAMLLRLLRGVLALLRMPRRQGAVLLARLRGLRLRRSRALARTEGERAAAAEAELRRLRAELRLARAERDEALTRLSASDAARRMIWPWHRGAARDERFLRAKRAFALRFHPDRLPRDATERAVRIALFREHWRELQRIERG
ncbi:hypothetical protein [Falsiroseomonas sp.]|uniref:hypothetical protein n=1 Tax=Falsiroseomonas sp. TaxID=2870721 RepID=UPI0035676C7B